MQSRRFLNIRDKTAVTARREKPKDAAQQDLSKSRPRSSELLNFLSKSDNSKVSAKNGADNTNNEKSEEDTKIESVASRLSELSVPGASPDYIRRILSSKAAAGDVEKAAKFIGFQHQAGAGKIVKYDAKVKMAGAENRGAVTCYLDALLFAMFARFDAFERMLKRDFENETHRKLATILRLWVNLLRSGELIHTDTTELLQETLAECGWADARLLEQQDTSEAFNFITETLELPLLSLKVDLFHHGKSDESDHKVIYERLLNLAVPPDPDGKGVRLEDCLEEYLNAQVDVLRDSLETKPTSTEAPSPSLKTTHSLDDKPVLTESPGSPKPTIRFVPDDDDVTSGSTTPKPDLSGFSASPRRATMPLTTGAGEVGSSSSSPTPLRQRSATVIQRVLIDKSGRPTGETPAQSQQLQRKGSVAVKAVTIPAWQFFRLMPWHTPSGTANNSQPRSDQELEINIRQRPVLGICLKRYGMTADGMPQRKDTNIDIPDVLRLPNFILDNEEHVEKDPHGFSTGYKLVLQSVVCHRGDSLQSGHYVALARVDPKLLTDNRRCDVDPPPDYEESQWVKFDDLLLESRVTPVEDLKQGLKGEMPYLLFYQIVPAIDSTDAMPTEPPAYNESFTDLSTLNPGDSTTIPTSRSPSTNTSVNATPVSTSSKPSIRISSDLDIGRPALTPSDEIYPPGSSRGNSRPQSITLADVFTDPSPHTPGTASPVAPTTPSEETTAQRLSRAAARFSRGSKSRNPSQQGEGRASLGMKLGLLRTSKEFLREAPSSPSTRAPSADGKEEVVEDKEKRRWKGKGKGKGVKGDKGDKRDKEDKGDVGEKTDGGDKGEKGDKADKGDESDRECVVM